MPLAFVTCAFFYRHLLGFISFGEVIAKILRIVNYYLFTCIYYLIAFIMITVLKKTREKNTFEQDTKTRDEGAGHTTERGFKLSVPVRKMHKY